MTSNSLVLVGGRFQPHQPPDPWETAKARFLEGLEPAERKLFHEATPQNLLYGASNAARDDSRDSKVRAGLNKINPLITAVEGYGKALDVYAQIAPLYLSPIWGSIRVLLILASTHSRFYSRMVDVFGQIGDLLPRFDDYVKLFNLISHPRFSEALSKAYLDIIELCIEFKKALQEQKTSRLKRAFQPLSTSLNLQFDEAITRFRGHRKAVEKEAEVCHMIEEKQSRDMVLRDKAEAEMRLRVHRQNDLISKLSDLDNRRKHRQMQRIRLAGTGSWALSIFGEWLKNPTPSILCCTGIPGSGKSVLISTFIDEVDKRSDPASASLMFFYCDYVDKGTLDPAKIFSNLCQQLLFQMRACPESVLVTIEKLFRYSQSPEVGDVVELLEEVIKLFSNLIVFIDGVDELVEKDQKLVVKTLWGLFGQLNADKIKVCISSREDVKHIARPPDILSAKTIHLGETEISGDINAFVEESIQKAVVDGDLVLGDELLKAEIVTSLVEGSKGMFLWVKFQISDLCSAHSDNAIRSMLRNLPKSLSEHYDRLLSRLERDEQSRMHGVRLFKWLLCARRPLVVGEVKEAIAFTVDNKHYDAALLPNDLQRISRACGHLVVIDQDSQVVQFAHYTVQQYLVDRPSDSHFRFTGADANNYAGLICLVYLSFSDFERQMTRYQDPGVTAGIAVIEKAILDPKVPNSLQSVGLFLSKLRSGSTLEPAHIDYARYIRLPRSTNDSEQTLAKFALLPYVTEHWLYHTTDLAKDTKLFQHCFVEVAFGPKLPFEFRPWDNIQFRHEEFPYLIEIGIALQLNHVPLMRESMNKQAALLAKSGSTSLQDVWSCFSNGVQSSFKNPISYENMTYHSFYSTHSISAHHSSPAPPKENWEEWFYYQILVASGKADISALRILVTSWLIHTEIPEVTLGHLLLEATLHSWGPIADLICSGVRSWHADEQESIWLETVYDGIKCDVFELACIRNFDVVTDSAIGKAHQPSPNSRLQNSLLKSDKLEVAFKQRDTTTLKACLRALGANRDKLETINYELELYSENEGKITKDTEVFSKICKIVETELYSRMRANVMAWAHPTRMQSEKFVSLGGHWIWATSSDFFSKIDLLLIVGTRPTFGDGLWLLEWTIQRCRSTKVEPERERLIRRVERLTDGRCKPFAGHEAHLSLTGEDQIQKLLGRCGLLTTVLPTVEYAILSKQYEIAKILITSGVLAIEKYHIFSPLHAAVLMGSLDMLKFIHEKRPPDHIFKVWAPLGDLRKFTDKHWPQTSDVSKKMAKKYIDDEKVFAYVGGPHYDRMVTDTGADQGRD